MSSNLANQYLHKILICLEMFMIIYENATVSYNLKDVHVTR